MQKLRRKKLVVPAIGTFAVVLTVFMVYFVAINRAELLLQQLVKGQSNGELIFNVDKVKLDIIHLRFEFRHPELQTRDTISTVTGYNIRAKSISFKAKSFIPFLLGKLIIIDSVLILNPEIDVLKYKETIKKKVSLPEEMSKVYKSLEIVLNVLNLNYLHINSARFKIFDYINPSNKPVEVSRLNLTVNKVTSEKGPGDKRFLFADRILLEVFNQDIVFSDGFHGIKFKRFSLNTLSQTIKLDSCFIYGKQPDSSAGEFRSFVDTVRISKLDLNQWAKNDILKMDSALCINPEVTFLIPLKEKRKRKNAFSDDLINKDSLDFVVKRMLGNLDIGYLTIKNAKVKIVTKRGTESKVYSTSNSNFSIENVFVNSDPKVPIQVGRFNLDVRNYEGYSPDSLYVVRFDNIQILNKKISLLNFRVGPTASNHELLSKEVRMEAFEFNNINWAILLYESRIVAGNVIMVKPELYFKLPGTKKSTTVAADKKNPFRTLEEIRKKVQIDDILIKDGLISIEDLKGTNFSINQLNARLNVNQLLKSTDAFGLMDALDTLTFRNGEYKNPSIQLLINEGSFSKESNSLILSQIIGENNDKSILAKMDNVNLNGIKIKSAEKISADRFTWEKADLTMSTGKAGNEKAVINKPKSDFKITIGHLSGGPTLMNFHGTNIEASTQVNHISTDEIVFENDHKPKIEGLTIDGQSFTLNQNQLKGSISGFNIYNRKISTLSNVIIRLPINKELANIIVPKLIFSADLFESINGKITADFIELQKPVISFTALPADFKNKTKSIDDGFPLLDIGRLTIDQPELTSLASSLPANIHIDPGKSSWNLIGLNSDSKTIKADSIRITLIQPNFRNDKIYMISTGKESVSFTGSDFAFNRRGPDNNDSWSVKMNTIKSSGLRFNTLSADTNGQKIAINSLNLENLILNNRNVSDLHELIKNNDHFLVSDGDIAIENSKTRIEAFNLTFDKSSNSLGIDSLSFRPLVDKDEFIKARQYQSNYMLLNTGLIKVKDIDFNLLINDSIFHSKKITINDLYFYDYKDKRLPFQHGIEKPLLTDLLKRINQKILIDSILLKNAGVVYEVFNDKTQQVGIVKLSKMRGAITGVKSDNFLPTDSIKFNLFARFMGATDLRTSYAQSYTDSLSSFQLKMIASSFNLKTLNPLLKPFASALIKRGYLDTIRMSVVGQKYVAYGIMKMHYHNLNVKYLNKGIEENPSLRSWLISFFANRMVNNKNLDGSGEVYAERDPEKGFVNYWVKIFIGGLFTNTGVRTDNKQEKKYNQSIEKYNVPPIPDIPVDF